VRLDRAGGRRACTRQRGRRGGRGGAGASDPPSRDGGAPTPPSVHPLDTFIVPCTIRILYGPYIYTGKVSHHMKYKAISSAHTRSLAALAMSESKRSCSSAISPYPMVTAQKPNRPSSISATAVHVSVTTSYRSTFDELPSPPAT
jgi:hypothetical protein